MSDDNHNYISTTPHSSLLLNAVEAVLFYTIFVIYGILRLGTATLIFCSNFLLRIGFSALFYFSLLLIASLALVIVLSYYLIAVFGSQIRLP